MAPKAFVVEDNPSIRQGLVEALADLAGIDTGGTADNEAAAVAWLTNPANAWDLAIVDLVLVPRGGSGLGVLRSLKDRPAGRKMLVLTGSASPDIRKQCMELGADAVFDKAMETEALIDWCIAFAQSATAARAPEAAP